METLNLWRPVMITWLAGSVVLTVMEYLIFMR